MAATGIVLFVLGVLMINISGARSKYSLNRVDYVGGAGAIIGVLLLLASAVKLAWSYLP